MRIRSIKPEFWASESVGRLDRDTRLVFVGLWSLADDHGRFRADPRFIAGQLLPYDDDGAKVVSRALASLREEGCVVLYEADRSQYGAVTGWERHQKIDRPSQSRLPQPTDNSLAKIREPSPSPREPSCEEQGAGNRERNREQGEEQGAAEAAGPLGGSEAFKLLTADVDPVDALRSLWNANRAPTMPEWLKTGATRRKHAQARLREHSLDDWERIIKRIAASDFASGRTGKWAASPDWLLESPNSAGKVLEGNYDNRDTRRNDGRAPVAAEDVDWSNAKSGEIAF